MERWYKFFKGQANRQFKFGDYEIKYVKKEVKEDFQPREEKTPMNMEKEQIKVFKNGVKVKIRKAQKLALIEAIKNDNLDKMESVVSSLKS